MATLILATALKIRGPLARDNVFVVERIMRGDVQNDADRRQNPRNLNGVVQDANRVHRYFTQQQHMIESDMVVQRPNQGKDDMIFSLQRKLKTQDVDVIFLYYTGHGTEENGDWAIARADEQDSFDTISLNEVLGTWEIGKETRNKNCELIIIADSCYSGAWVEEINRRSNSYDPEERATVANVSMVASCKANETCFETEEGGDFTTYLIKPLRSFSVHTKNISLKPMSLNQADGDDDDDLDGKLLKDMWKALTRSKRRLHRNTGNFVHHLHDILEMAINYARRVYRWAFDIYVVMDPCLYIILVILFSPVFIFLYVCLHCCFDKRQK